MTTSTEVIIRGHFYERGYLCDLAPPSLVAHLIDGKLYADLFGRPGERIRIEDDELVSGLGADITFSPLPGELARLGLEG